MAAFRCDCHSHSAYSPDAKDTAEVMCLRAAELGLDAYALTDHCDCNYWLTAEEYESAGNRILRDRDMFGARDYARQSIETVSRLKERFPFLICGTELGQPLQNLTAAEEISARPELDFIIGSHHQNAGCDDFYWLDYSKLGEEDIYRLLDDYFGQMLDMCRWGGFDVLGHLTYPMRYITGEYGISIGLRRYEERIREIFRVLAENGKGIEINTSGLRQKYGRMFPDREYVTMWRECGGEIVTVGSDAHCRKDLAAGTEQGIELARGCGFRYIAYFRERKPIFVRA